MKQRRAAVWTQQRTVRIQGEGESWKEDWGEPPGLKTEVGISERIRGRLLC